MEQRAKEIKELDMTKDLLPIERALRVQWFVESDKLHFRAELNDRPLTRRGILSTVSSVYDPLGLISPFLLKSKIILQGICKDDAHWDDPMPDPVQMQWVKWREDLGTLARLKIPRCYKPVDFGEVKSVELHNFSDASTSGYGQCSYLKMTDLQGKIYCTLAMAKSRVTPSKPITVPRLELTAALLSVKISSFLKKDLKSTSRKSSGGTASLSEDMYPTIQDDSTPLLQIEFSPFVEYSEPNKWRREDTKENPADEASRGLSAEELVNSPRWWSGSFDNYFQATTECSATFNHSQNEPARLARQRKNFYGVMKGRPGARFLKAPETSWACKAILSSSVSKTEEFIRLKLLV